VASLHTAGGRIAVAGLRADRPRADGAGGAVPGGAGGAARRPAVVVTDLSTSAAGRTVVPARAAATLNLRLAPGQVPSTVGGWLHRHLAARVPDTVHARLTLGRGCPPYALDPHAWPVAAALRASTVAFGRPAELLPSGGSIPFVSTLAAAAGIPALLLGFGLPDDGAHSANERVHLPTLYRGTKACTELYRMLGCAGRGLR
jgi:acetylornithine deacetylase/succinyl-diaminopimelate desuccinylase-like protein